MRADVGAPVPRFLQRTLAHDERRHHVRFEADAALLAAISEEPGRVPFALVLEAMAEAALALAPPGGATVRAFEAVRVDGVPRLAPHEHVELVAEREGDRIAVQVKTGGLAWSARGTVVLGERAEPPVQAVPLSARPSNTGTHPLPRSLGARAGAWHLESGIAVALGPSPSPAPLFETGTPPALGDWQARELLLRAAGWRSGQGRVVGFEKLELFRGGGRDVSRTLVVALERAAVRATEQGKVHEQLTGVALVAETEAPVAPPAVTVAPKDLGPRTHAQLGCQVLEHVFHIGWRECWALDRTVPPAQLVRWFHHGRDLLLGAEMGRAFAQQMRAGEAGGAILSSEARRDGALTAYDLVRLTLWVEAIGDSAVTWRGDFEKLDAQGGATPVGAVRSRGVFRAQGQVALPEKHRALYRPFVATRPTVWVEPPKPPPSLPSARPVLRALPFTPGLVDSDLLGNVNNVGYFLWQEQVRDALFHELTQALSRQSPLEKPRAVVQTLACEVSHLREAMPFEPLVAELRCESMGQTDAWLRTDFVRTVQGRREKVGSGLQQVRWAVLDANGDTVASEWPPALATTLSRPSASDPSPTAEATLHALPR